MPQRFREAPFSLCGHKLGDGPSAAIASTSGVIPADVWSHDTTNRTGDDVTPEVSGIFSFANDDKTFGVGLSASYQKRDSGSWRW